MLILVPSVGQSSFLHEEISEKAHQQILCQCPQSGNPHFYGSLRSQQPSASLVCVNALNRAILISTLPPKKPFIYAGFKPHFCGYFSEYSENLALTDPKVGKGEIVFFQVQF